MQTAHSPALMDSRSRIPTRLRAHALRLQSSVTVGARTQVHALQPTQESIRGSDGLAVAIA
jgi:hypothetical protein